MKHIISIGINKTEGLTQLGGAVSGAEDFAAWGKSQGYTTTLFVDDKKAVTQTAIFDKISKIIAAKNCETLIVFFSGHGILKSPSQEVWLLSNAKNNPNESINLTGSIDNARTSGIPYIVFISDACRVLPNELQFTGNGSVIFPICDDTNQECFIDVLYATRPGNPALEQNSASNANKFGLFTHTIVDILKGHYPELIKAKKTGESLVNYYSANELYTDLNYKELGKDVWQIDIINSELSLKDIVAQKASKINISLSQNPDIRIQYQNPKPNLSEFKDKEAKELLLQKNEIESYENASDDNAKEPEAAPENENFKDSIFKSDIENEILKESFSKDIDPQINILKKSKQLILNSKGRVSFETMTGFTIIGIKIKNVMFNGFWELFVENEMDNVRIHPQAGLNSGLLILENGNSIPIAILEGYIGTLVFDKAQLVTINYTPSLHNENFKFFENNEAGIDNLRASVASKASMGFDYSSKFLNDFDDKGTLNLQTAGNYLLQGNSIDLSLGLYAAYGYRQEGKLKEISTIFDTMKKGNQKIIFDVAMLAGKMKDEHLILAPFCPMLALGWAYSQHFEKEIHPLIMVASNHLVPGLWTTFDSTGTKIITKMFNEKLIS